MSSTPLSAIPTLTLLYKLARLHPSDSTAHGASSAYNDKISLVRTDITKLATDSIVNAANESLLGGGGVDGAIHRAAGRALLKECETLHGCATGDAKITGAYKLPCKKVIHAVGPVYHATKRRGMHTQLLSSCYTNSLTLAAEHDCKSIAFSALSTGVYGYPSDEAAETAIAAVKGWLDEDEQRSKRIERIVFCSFLAKDEKAYEEYIPKFFPPGPGVEEQGGGGVNAEEEAGKDVQKPELPSVPTSEPKEEGQPEAKKPKVDKADAAEKHMV